MSSWYFSKNVLPYWVILVADALIVFACSIISFWIINGGQFTAANLESVLLSSLFYAILSWVGARIYKTYAGILRYTSFVDLLKLTYANLVSMGLAVLCCVLFHSQGWTLLSAHSILSTCLVFAFSTMAMWLFRMLVKTLYETATSKSKATRVLIYGALNGGIGLANNIRSEDPLKYDLRGFITHEKRIKDMKLLGVPVYTADQDFGAIVRRERIKGVLVTPSCLEEFRANQRIQDEFINNGAHIFMVHAAQEAVLKDGMLVENNENKVQIQEVSVEDLLPRSEIRVDLKSVGEQLAGKRVLITGSAGSIGMEIVRQVAHFNVEKLMLIDQAETPQHDVRLMMAREFPHVPCEVVVASISRRTRMEYVFRYFRPDYVFHAAAYKHVPMMEDNPSEAVLNNVYGTKVIADMSVKYGARKFVMVSTDKAVNPTNVMGCSKRISEIYVQSLDRKLKMEAMAAAKGKDGPLEERTQFVTTRFGNVLGSNGSVIPLFREQIKRGGPVTVTDERIVRYFMLIPEACKLVLEAGTKGNGGEIFVFDMGAPVKIADLAKRMIAMSGARNVKIEYTGLRDGEKLYEEVLGAMEGTKPTFHEKIRIAQVREYDYDAVSKEIEELTDVAKLFDNMETVRKMKRIVPEYKSNNSVYEQLDAEMDQNGGG